MLFLLFLLILLKAVGNEAENEKHEILHQSGNSLYRVREDESDINDLIKRNLWQFGKVIRCMTGRSPWDYNNYGCYCGMGGRGKIVDGVDRCCYEHDRCYGRAPGRCWPKWTIYERGGWWSSCTFRCSDPRESCKRHVCECDVAAAQCFRRNRYNAALKGYKHRYQC
ncbi:basic phospholipase A2 [Nematostella vectensis]|uniref:basic phospholipase A2 n=1 Tax=Nematostella vectensis TaxID=45351 RepID=UPI001390019D|nr:basic phospholipase A2 [Nematostella vectensis]